MESAMDLTNGEKLVRSMQDDLQMLNEATRIAVQINSWSSRLHEENKRVMFMGQVSAMLDALGRDLLINTAILCGKHDRGHLS